jgi:hypothetical protein
LNALIMKMRVTKRRGEQTPSNLVGNAPPSVRTSNEQSL